MEELRQLIEKELELRRALEAMGARWVLDPDKPGHHKLVSLSESITPEFERVRVEWVKIKEQIDRLTGVTESDAEQGG